MRSTTVQGSSRICSLAFVSADEDRSSGTGIDEVAQAELRRCCAAKGVCVAGADVDGAKIGGSWACAELFDGDVGGEHGDVEPVGLPVTDFPAFGLDADEVGLGAGRIDADRVERVVGGGCRGRTGWRERFW